MSYRLVYEPGAGALVRRLPPDLKSAITQAIESLRINPYAGKPLRFALAAYRSLRSSRQRIIYRVRESPRVVEILHFGVRRDVYEMFRRLLKS